MSIKIVLLKSGETLITDAKEFVTENRDTGEQEVQGYLFNKPNLVEYCEKSFLSEEIKKDDTSEGSNIQVVLSPWILFTNDEDITVPKDWVVTITEPVSSLKEMYKEKING